MGCPCRVRVQVELDETRFYLTRSLLSTNDSASDEFAAACLVSTRQLMQWTYDLYQGNASFPGILQRSADEVGGPCYRNLGGDSHLCQPRR